MNQIKRLAVGTEQYERRQHALDLRSLANMMRHGRAYDADLLATLAIRTTAQRAALMELARKEKCFSSLAMIYRDAGYADRELSLELERVSMRNASARQLSVILPAGVLLLKGLALERFYRPDVQRDCVDIDVCVNSPEVILELAVALSERGYHVTNTMLWKLNPDDEQQLPAGGVRFVSSDNASVQTEVEVHFGGFATSLCTGIEAHELWQFAIHDASLSLAVHSLNPTGQLLLILADYAAKPDAAVTIRHVIDVLQFFAAVGAQVDLPMVRAALWKHGICDSVNALKRKIVDCGIQDLPPLLEELLRDAALERAGRWHRNLYWRSFVAQSSVGHGLSTRITRFVLYGYRTLTLTLRDYRGVRIVLRWTEYSALNLRLARWGMRLAVVPISRQRSKRFSYRRIGGRLFYSTPIGIFSVSQHGLFDQSERQAMFRLLQQIHQ